MKKTRILVVDDHAIQVQIALGIAHHLDPIALKDLIRQIGGDGLGL